MEFLIRPATAADVDRHGKRVGRGLIDHAIATARSAGAGRIKVVSDPHAEQFYLKMGAVRAGEEASIPKGRMLRVLFLDLESGEI